MYCGYCLRPMIEAKSVERKGEEKMIWDCPNCGIRLKVWSLR